MGKRIRPGTIAGRRRVYPPNLGLRATVGAVIKTVQEAVERKAQEEAEKKAAEAARTAQWRAEYDARQAAYAASQENFELMFDGVEEEIPEGFFFKITSRGLEVWRDRGESWFHNRYYDQETLTTLDAFDEWLQTAKAKLYHEAERNRARAEEDAKAEAQRQAALANKAADEAVIKAKVSELDALLASL